MIGIQTEKRILVLNCGSSSLKYEVYSMPARQSLGRGLVERIGESEGKLVQTSSKGESTVEQTILDHGAAMELVGRALVDPEIGILNDLSEIGGVGHRVVHGGERFSASVIIDPAVIEAIEEAAELAPLHNPPNLTGIREAQRLKRNRLGQRISVHGDVDWGAVDLDGLRLFLHLPRTGVGDQHHLHAGRLHAHAEVHGDVEVALLRGARGEHTEQQREQAQRQSHQNLEGRSGLPR